MRRNYGRRQNDRFKIAAGIGIGFVFFMLALQSRCGGGNVTGPTPKQPTRSSQQAAATPAPSSTPSLADPAAGTPFDVSFTDGACFTLKNNGVNAALASFYTSFDDQVTPFDTRKKVVAGGGTWSECYNKPCIQVDVDQPGVKLIAGGFFDKDMKSFIPSRSPEKVAACRTTPCVEKWIFDEEKFNTSYGEWGSCTRPEVTPSGVESQTQTVCSKKRTVTRTYYETNSCSGERRVARTSKTEESTPCECPCVSLDTKRETTDYGPWSNPNSYCGARSKTVTTYTLNTCTQVETHAAPVVTTENKDCPFCHVAADGSPKNANDFDVEIQTTQFNFPWPAGNPGHNSHLDPAHFCPQDYWGTCSSTVAKNEIKGIVCAQHSTKESECKKWAFTCVVPE